LREYKRLLTWKEQEDVYIISLSDDDYWRKICAAQDAKTTAARDKEWVEWFETLEVGKYCMVTECKFWQDCVAGATTACLKFQRRKRDIGL
jgi:hypothetical protein